MPASHRPDEKPKKSAVKNGLKPSPVTVRVEESRRQPVEPQAGHPAARPWRPVSILQAIHVSLCMMIFPYLLTVTLSRWQVNLWLAALVSALIGTGIFVLLYRRTRDVKLFKFE
jgi:hypothetical protein